MAKADRDGKPAKAASPPKRRTATAKTTRSRRTSTAAASASSAATSKSRPPSRTTKSRSAASRPSSRKSSSATPSSSSSKKKKSAVQKTAASVSVLPPARTLIVDNGGSTLKYGLFDGSNDASVAVANNNDEASTFPHLLPNVTARLLHQLTVLVGDELSHVNNPGSLHSQTRSMERGIISNLGNQTQVWRRMLDKLGVAYDPNSEAAKTLGWLTATGKRNKAVGTESSSTLIPAHTIAVFILLPPHCPRLLLDQIMYVWMEDFGVSHVGFGVSQAYAGIEHGQFKTSVCVDLGWSATHIVPTFRRKIIRPTATRRMPIAGRHMINMFKHYMSYRQYNLMDQETILTDVFERLAYVSLQYERELNMARLHAVREYDREYILPDHQTTHQGQIRLSPALERRLKAEADNEAGIDQDEDDDEDDESVNSDNVSDDGDDEDVEYLNEGRDTNDVGDDVAAPDEDDDNETPEQLQQRVLKQRAEEERRRRQEEMEQQILRVSVERFTVPEVLFRPLDAGLTADLVGLATAIHQSIESCPKCYRPPLYQSICLTGGVCKLPNLKQRLERELRQLVPNELEMEVRTVDDPIGAAWRGACEWIRSAKSHTEWSVSRDEWEASSKRRAYKKLLPTNGGVYV